MALASGSDRANLSSLAGVQRVACLSLAQTGLLPVGARQPVINPNPVQAHAQVPRASNGSSNEDPVSARPS